MKKLEENLFVFFRYAVSRLAEAPDEDLLLYLLQLVQALKYESFDEMTGAKRRPAEPEQDLASFLISRASNNSALANYFYWYLLTECEDHDHSKQDNKVKILKFDQFPKYNFIRFFIFM